MAADKMQIDEALGAETEEEPYATDELSDYNPDENEPRKRAKKMGKKKEESQPDKSVKKVQSSKVTKKKTTREDKMKLADIVKGEEIIYNLQHKLHSNGPALLAAWERVATKMDRSGEYFINRLLNYSDLKLIGFLFFFFYLQYPSVKRFTRACAMHFAINERKYLENQVIVGTSWKMMRRTKTMMN